MTTLTRADLWSLEDYSEKRAEFRAQVLEHKKNRHLQLNEHGRLLFEDALTLKYQIQEMLRIEKVFEADGIQEELDAYNPLIPDGDNWKATFMIEYEDVDERKLRLEELKNVEDLIWMQVEGFDKVYPIADEDMDRENETKTSSVHFVRFQLSQEMIAAAKNGADILAGCDHAAFKIEPFSVPTNIADSLRSDLD
ncbi:MAG: DUF3501 family protein [Gammaproteobacteria bacterium]|nr:DUF3501 family protein [Gammaproteobacteria bacterium]